MATHAILALAGHDASRVDDGIWVGANLVAHAILQFDALMRGLAKK